MTTSERDQILNEFIDYVGRLKLCYSGVTIHAAAVNGRVVFKADTLQLKRATGKARYRRRYERRREGRCTN